MVVLKGNVIDAKKSNAYHTVYISGAVMDQGSGWAVVTDASGAFYTSANTALDQLTMTKPGYDTVTINVPVFSTHYDGSQVISGSLTHDVTVANGVAYVQDNRKIFIPNTMSGRVITMQGGMDDGKTGLILGNTVNTISVGGTSGGGGGGWQRVTATPGWTPRDGAALLSVDKDTFYMMGGYTDSGVTNEVWITYDVGSTWTLVTSSPGWSPRTNAAAVQTANGTILLIGGDDGNGTLYPDVWAIPGYNWSLGWTQQTTVTPGWRRQGAVGGTAFTQTIDGGENVVFVPGHTNYPWFSTDLGITWWTVPA